MTMHSEVVGYELVPVAVRNIRARVWSAPIVLTTSTENVVQLLLELNADEFELRASENILPASAMHLLCLTFTDKIDCFNKLKADEPGYWVAGDEIDQYKVNSELFVERSTILQDPNSRGCDTWITRDPMTNPSLSHVPQFHKREMMVLSHLFSSYLSMLNIGDHVTLTFYSHRIPFKDIVEVNPRELGRPNVVRERSKMMLKLETVGKRIYDSSQQDARLREGDVTNAIGMALAPQIDYQQPTEGDRMDGLQRYLSDSMPDDDHDPPPIKHWYHDRLSAVMAGREPNPSQSEIRVHELAFPSFADFIMNVRKFDLRREYTRTRVDDRPKFMLPLISVLPTSRPSILCLKFDADIIHSHTENGLRPTCHLGNRFHFKRALMKESAVNCMNNLRSMLFISNAGLLYRFKLICVVESATCFPQKLSMRQDQQPNGSRTLYRISVQITDLSIGVPRNSDLYPGVHLGIQMLVASTTELPIFMIGDLLLLSGVQLRKNESKQSAFLDLMIDLTKSDSSLTVFRMMEAKPLDNADHMAVEDRVKFDVSNEGKPSKFGLTDHEKNQKHPWRVFLDPNTHMWGSGELRAMDMHSLILFHGPKEGKGHRIPLRVSCVYTSQTQGSSFVKMDFRRQITMSIIADRIWNDLHDVKNRLAHRQYEIKLVPSFLMWLTKQLYEISLVRHTGIENVFKIVSSGFLQNFVPRSPSRSHQWGSFDPLVPINGVDVVGSLERMVHRTVALNGIMPQDSDIDCVLNLNDVMNGMYSDPIKRQSLYLLLGISSSNDYVIRTEEQLPMSGVDIYHHILQLLISYADENATIPKYRWTPNYCVVKERHSGQFILMTGYCPEQFNYMANAPPVAKRLPTTVSGDVKFRSYSFLPVLVRVKPIHVENGASCRWLPVAAADCIVEQYQRMNEANPCARLSAINSTSSEKIKNARWRSKGVTLYPKLLLDDVNRIVM